MYSSPVLRATAAYSADDEFYVEAYSTSFDAKSLLSLDPLCPFTSRRIVNRIIKFLLSTCIINTCTVIPFQRRRLDYQRIGIIKLSRDQ
jgi:hypothetical protein